MRNRIKLLGVAALAMALIFGSWAGQASATLNLFVSFQDAALSVDGGTDPTTNGPPAALQSNVPVGATVVAAYLYAADVFGSNATPVGSVTLAGNVLNLSTFTKLTPNENPANTYRLNVTDIMKPIIEATGGLQTHTYTESSPGSMDGAVLVVAYRNASTVGGTAIILDGELAQAGDSTTLGFAAPYAGGSVIMSLASSFSCCDSTSGTAPNPVGQVTTVDIVTSSQASRRLTQCAGGNDDGGFNGAGFNSILMTVGGIGDSTSNPLPNCTGGAGDDELYDLSLGNAADSDPFLTLGDTSITFNTRNPSFDDNVFFLGFTSAIRVGEVDDISTDDTPSDDTPSDDGPQVPAPATLVLLGLGLLGAGIASRFRR